MATLSSRQATSDTTSTSSSAAASSSPATPTSAASPPQVSLETATPSSSGTTDPAGPSPLQTFDEDEQDAYVMVTLNLRAVLRGRRIGFYPVVPLAAEMEVEAPAARPATDDQDQEELKKIAELQRPCSGYPWYWNIVFLLLVTNEDVLSQYVFGIIAFTFWLGTVFVTPERLYSLVSLTIPVYYACFLWALAPQHQLHPFWWLYFPLCFLLSPVKILINVFNIAGHKKLFSTRPRANRLLISGAMLLGEVLVDGGMMLDYHLTSSHPRPIFLYPTETFLVYCLFLYLIASIFLAISATIGLPADRTSFNQFLNLIAWKGVANILFFTLLFTSLSSLMAGREKWTSFIDWVYEQVKASFATGSTT